MLVCLAGMFGTAIANAGEARHACPAQPQQGAHAGARSRDAGRIPRVKVPRQRCTPAPVHTDRGCLTDSAARATNPPPPAGTEPSFGDVPVATLMPPSVPSSGEPAPGPARASPKAHAGCRPRPAS
jgi:hypothetical protein